MNRCRVDLSNCIRRVPSNISAQNVYEDQSVGLKRKSVDAICMSVLGRKQTFRPYSPDVRFTPKADIPQQGLECHPKDETKSCDDRVGVECPTGRQLSQTCRHCHVPRLVQADGSSGRRRQVDVSTSNPRTAVVDANCDASAVANANLSAERQPAMGGGHCRTI